MRYKFVILFYFIAPWTVFGQVEICDNGIDDDFDNLIDLNDDDCACEIIEPISVIPNPSFEDMDCCPSDRSELDCASLWIQASEPTTDFIHTCDWLGWDDFPPPMPFPDGEGIMGFRDGRVRNNNEAQPYWKEYAGACLISPLLADSSYRIQFDIGFVNSQRSPPIDISFFGTTSCDNLPFGIGNEEFGCPSNSVNWSKLGEVTVSGGTGNKWVNTFIEIIPDEDIYAIAIGPDCNPISSPVSIYYFFDNLLLSDIESFDLQIKEIQHPCSSDFTLSIANNPDFTYQWYKSGIALAGETSAEMSQNYGEGTYQVSVLDGTTCRLSAEYEYIIPVFNLAPNVTLCPDVFYQFGDLQLTESGFYLDTFLSQNNCDSIVALELEVIGENIDTLEVAILEGETFEIAGQSLGMEGEYPLIFTSSLGCDSLVLLDLTVFNVFIPNAFSADDDGINDVFYPFAPVGEINSVSMQIFDRWGNIVFQGTEWNGGQLQPGVYVYLINIDFTFGKSKVFSGDVTLLR